MGTDSNSQMSAKMIETPAAPPRLSSASDGNIVHAQIHFVEDYFIHAVLSARIVNDDGRYPDLKRHCGRGLEMPDMSSMAFFRDHEEICQICTYEY